MFDLLEKILEVSAYGVVGYADGWITPSGEFVEIIEESHEKDAYQILRSRGHSEEFLKKKNTSLLDFFYSETRYIRCVIGTKENEVDVFVPDIKVTRRQMSTIRKFAQTYEDFYYTIKADAHGWDFPEFMKDARKYLEMEG